VCVCVQVIYVKLSVVMGLGWLLGFVAAYVDRPALWYAFIVANSLQGALLCAAFILTRQVARLITDCVRPLLSGRGRGATPATAPSSSNNELSPSQTGRAKSAAIPHDDTEIARLSLT